MKEYLTELYLQNEKDKRLESYLSQYEDELLSVISDNDSEELSILSLNRDYILSSSREEKLLDLGLLRENRGSIEITDRGKKIVSDYPLFGTYSKSKEYTDQFFPMLLSLIASGDISSRANHYTRYLSSDFFTAIFPTREKEEVSTAAIKTVRALFDLGLVKDNSGRTSLRLAAATSFMEISEESRLSYVLHPDSDDRTRELAAKAISLVFRLRSIDEDKLYLYLDRIESITGYRFTDIEFLFNFGILYREEGKISGYRRTRKPSEDGVISSDFTLTYTGTISEPIYLFCSPDKADIVSGWTITKKNMKAAFSAGYNPDTIIKTLKKLSKTELPDTIEARIRSWYESFSALTAERGVVLTADSRNAKILAALPLLKIHVLSRPSENVFIMNPSTEEEWRKLLTYSGFDMLGETKGWEMHRPEKDPHFISYKTPDTLPERRAIPYSRERVRELIEKSSSILERTLVLSGLIFSSSQKSWVKTIEGLYYQEKLKAVTHAADKKLSLYLMNIDKSERIIKPLHVERQEEEAYIITASERISVDKIWKAAELPSYIITEE